VPADAHDAARRIVAEVFGGSAPAEVEDAPMRDSPSTPIVSAPSEREASLARLRARELVAEVFDAPGGSGLAPGSSPAGQRSSTVEASPAAARPTTSAAPRSGASRSAAPTAAPTAAELAGRRIVAEAEAAQQDRAAAEAAERAAAERTAQQAEAAERAAAQRAAEEAEAAAHRERAQRARQEWLAQAQAAATTEEPPAAPTAVLPGAPVASPASAAPPETPAPTPSEAAAEPPVGSEEVLFVPLATDPSAPEEGEALFDTSPSDEHPGLPPSSASDVAGPPPPPAPRVAAELPRELPVAPGVREDASVAARPQGPVALALPEDPPDPQLAARLVSEVLEERAGDPQHGAVAEPPTTAATGARALRAGRWVLVTVLAAVTLALLFPLAVRAVLELVSLS
jgi:hypothetical protein